MPKATELTNETIKAVLRGYAYALQDVESAFATYAETTNTPSFEGAAEFLRNYLTCKKEQMQETALEIQAYTQEVKKCM